MAEELVIHTLGNFFVSLGGKDISDATSRSRKVWTIFKYLLTNRHRLATTEALIEVLWPIESPDDPLKTLYSHVSRLRRLLQAGGKSVDYILYRQNGYQWNPQAPVYLDIVDFEQTVKMARSLSVDEDKLLLLQRAVELYGGDFLADSSHESWALPLVNYYKRLYIQAVNELAEIYARNSAQDEIISLCNRAIQLEPYEETLYVRLIQALLINGETAQAQKCYQCIADLLFKELGAQPSQELQILWLEMRGNDSEQADIVEIKNRLEARDEPRGAYFCTADMFKQFYQFDKRSDERLNFPVFLGLITISSADGTELTTKQIKSAMSKLRQCMMRTLRQGDVVSQYSRCQYLTMLSAYFPKDAETALVRIRKLFIAEYAGEPCNLQTNLSKVGNMQMNSQTSIGAG